jgi:hypothetical protein
MALISFSCSFQEIEIPESPIQNEFVDALIHITSAPSSYALSDPDGEEMIKEVDLLAFKLSGTDEYYAYRTRTTAINPTAQGKEFIVSVKKSANNEKYRFVIIGNASEAVSAANFSTLATKKQVYASIISDLSGSGRWDAAEVSPGVPVRPIPMWGEASVAEVVTDNMVIQPIRMLRALSRIDVAVKSEVQPKFRLTDVYVYNYKKKGRVIPDMDSVKTDGNVKGASIPVDNNLTVKGPIQYTSSSTVKYEREIYLYEADAVKDDEALQATCFVIGGYYDVSSAATEKSYYRVDFVDKTINNAPSFKPILRNHCYIINIADVKNEGEKTPEGAFEKMKTNMTVEIKSWLMGEDPYEGTPYNFAVSRNLFENIGADLFKGSFALTVENPTGWTSSASQGITLNPSSGTKVTNQTISFDVESSAPSPLTIQITSGQITKKIVITR